MGRFDGKVALVTGGGTGIGRSTAHLLAAEGCNVVVSGRRTGPLEETAAPYPERINPVACDIGVAADRSRAVDAAVEMHGGLDILVNNAAIQATKPFTEHSCQEIEEIVHVNLTSQLLLTHLALPLIVERRGTIVNIGSAGARYSGMPPALISVYSAAKAGLHQMTRILATELGASGVRVNAVSPGLTDTPLATGATSDPAAMEYLLSITPLGRLGQPDEVARVVLFLAGPDAGWVTGQVVDATGGFWLAS